MAKIVNGIFSLTIVGLIVAALGIIAPIAWDWWRSSSSLTLTQVQESILVEKKANIPGLEIIYDGRKVENLSKLIFRLENSGRTPITEDDLVDPPVININDSVILSAVIEETKPPNLMPTIKIEKSAVRLSFRLLNANDSITFSILADGIRPTYSAASLIKNISEIEVVRSEDRISLNKDVGWSVYVVGWVSVFFSIVGFGMLAQIPRRARQLRKIKNKETPIHAGEPMSVIRSYVDSDLDFLSGRQELAVEAALSAVTTALPKGVSELSEEQARELLAVIEQQIKEEPMIAAGLLVLAMCAIGAWYVFSNVIVNGV